MTLKQIILLKLSSILLLALYLVSFLWVSIMYLYGIIYSPIINSSLHQPFLFELLVSIFSIFSLFVILQKVKGVHFFHFLIQNTGITIISIPFYFMLFSLFGYNIDNMNNPVFGFITIILLTVLTISFNDYKKIKLRL